MELHDEEVLDLMPKLKQSEDGEKGSSLGFIAAWKRTNRPGASWASASPPR